VIDSRIVITGSYNWTVSAESTNEENTLFLECPELAEQYEEGVGLDQMKEQLEKTGQEKDREADFRRSRKQ
jgi:phosphatidylserine/phosphatidylglycerophosphate/cardiolipin synthase-like enzyme